MTRSTKLKLGGGALAVVVALLLLSPTKESITPGNWTCEKLVKPVIDMSKERDSKILEITNVQNGVNSPGNTISCTGNAEWSDGEGGIEFGAHVSEGNQIIIEYKRL